MVSHDTKNTRVKCINTHARHELMERIYLNSKNRPTKHTPEGKDRHTGQTYRKLMAQLTRFQLVVKSMQTVRGSEA